MNWWIITTLAFACLAFAVLLLAGWLVVDLKFEKRRTTAVRALHDTVIAENMALQGEIIDLREALSAAQHTVPVVEAPKPPRRKRTEAP